MGTAADSERAVLIRNALAKIRDKNGRLTPRMVLDAARNPKHPMHHLFDWNDKTAAEQYRLEQARGYIRYVTVAVIERSTTCVVPMYVRDMSVPAREQGFIESSFISNRDHAEKTLMAELDRCKSAIERARGVVGILNRKNPGLDDQLQEMLERIVLIQQRFDVAAE